MAGIAKARKELRTKKATWVQNATWVIETLGLKELGYIPRAHDAPSALAFGMLIMAAEAPGKFLAMFVNRMLKAQGEQNIDGVVGAVKDDGGKIGALMAFMKANGEAPDELPDEAPAATEDANELVQTGPEGPFGECGVEAEAASGGDGQPLPTE